MNSKTKSIADVEHDIWNELWDAEKGVARKDAEEGEARRQLCSNCQSCFCGSTTYNGNNNMVRGSASSPMQ